MTCATRWVPRPGQRALVEFDEEEVVARVLDTYREVATRKGVAPIMTTLRERTDLPSRRLPRLAVAVGWMTS